MLKITFMGAGSTVFVRNVLGDCMRTPALWDAEMALYDINAERLEESRVMLEALNKNINEGRATIRTYLGVENRKEALRGARFVVNAIQVGGYEPCTVIALRFPRSTACARPLPTLWASAASCAVCGPSLSWTASPGTWRKSVPTRCC